MYHLVDSDTVLCQINKLSTRFQVYEGVRIGEIQAATGGNVSCWGWVPGKENIADWVTCGRCISEIGPDFEWYNGPAFLYCPIDQWNVSFKLTETKPLPGEKVPIKENKVEK